MFSTETEKGHAPEHVVATPIWMLAIRVAQFLVALIIVGLAGALMHDAYLDEEGLALAIVRPSLTRVGRYLQPNCPC
jgi:hypothetical protein